MSFNADAAKTLIENAVKEFLRGEKNLAHLKRGRVERTCASDLGGYGYKLGLFLVFGIEEKSGELLVMDWFVDGKKV